MENQNYMANVSDDQNTAKVNAVNYKFVKTHFNYFRNNPCSKCEIKDACWDLSRGKIDFPFPCNSDVRTDGRNGIFRRVNREKMIRFRRFAKKNLTPEFFLGIIVGISISLIPLVFILISLSNQNQRLIDMLP